MKKREVVKDLTMGVGMLGMVGISILIFVGIVAGVIFLLPLVAPLFMISILLAGILLVILGLVLCIFMVGRESLRLFK